MKAKRKSAALFATALALGMLELLFLVSPAHAIIGMPLTPFSYAGVARRTTRRAVVAGSMMYGGGMYGGAPYASPVYW